MHLGKNLVILILLIANSKLIQGRSRRVNDVESKMDGGKRSKGKGKKGRDESSKRSKGKGKKGRDERSRGSKSKGKTKAKGGRGSSLSNLVSYRLSAPPSYRPSVLPTSSPSPTLSTLPSVNPSSIPTTSKAPTTMPITQPSPQPTKSTKPSLKPFSSPSSEPFSSSTPTMTKYHLKSGRNWVNEAVSPRKNKGEAKEGGKSNKSSKKGKGGGEEHSIDLAFGCGIAFQSSTKGSETNEFDANNAIDGKQFTSSKTTIENKSWWTVKLPHEAFIEKVAISPTPSTGSNEHILAFQVVIIDSNGKETMVFTLFDFEFDADSNLILPIDSFGQMVMIRTFGENSLILSTVNVIGSSYGPCTKPPTPNPTVESPLLVYPSASPSRRTKPSLKPFSSPSSEPFSSSTPTMTKYHPKSGRNWANEAVSPRKNKGEGKGDDKSNKSSKQGKGGGEEHPSLSDLAFECGIAFQSNTEESNTANGFDANNAIDRNQLTSSKTTIENNAWWTVKLPHEAFIEKVAISPTPSTGSNEHIAFQVAIIDSNDKETMVFTLFDFDADSNLVLPIDSFGQMVMIRTFGENSLILSTVKVIGSSYGSCTKPPTPNPTVESPLLVYPSASPSMRGKG